MSLESKQKKKFGLIGSRGMEMKINQDKTKQPISRLPEMIGMSP